LAAKLARFSTEGIPTAPIAAVPTSAENYWTRHIEDSIDRDDSGIHSQRLSPNDGQTSARRNFE
jgi:hypothetical protein